MAGRIIDVDRDRTKSAELQDVVVVVVVGLTFADEAVSARESVGSSVERRSGRGGRGGWDVVCQRMSRRHHGPVRIISARFAATATAAVKCQHQGGHGAVVAQRVAVAEPPGSFGRHGAHTSVGRRPFVHFATVQVQIQRQMVAISASKSIRLDKVERKRNQSKQIEWHDEGQNRLIKQNDRDDDDNFLCVGAVSAVRYRR